jgi:hypothetical protein
MVVRHLTPAVRPDDILVGLRHVSGLEQPSPARMTRLAQVPLDTDATAGPASAPGPDSDAGRASLSGSRAAFGSMTADGVSGALGPAQRDLTQGPVRTTREHAWNVGTTDTASLSASEQLPRGAEQPAQADCARGPDERDRPNARNRATEQRVR